MVIANKADAMVVIGELTRERDAARAENERLRTALSILVAYIDNRHGRVFVGAPALSRARGTLEGAR